MERSTARGAAPVVNERQRAPSLKGADCIFGGSVNSPLYLAPGVVASFSLMQTQALLWQVWLKRLYDIHASE